MSPMTYLGFPASDTESDDLCDAMIDSYAKGVPCFKIKGNEPWIRPE